VKLAISDVARLTGGEQFGEHRVVSGAAVDSRTVKGGELFVPLRAARDGHAWISAALAAGAAAYLTELEPQGGDGTCRCHAQRGLRPASQLSRARVARPATRPLLFEMLASACAGILTPHPSGRIIDEQS
jgi:UDP-N-acetylmuramyl pentapeptide synthase